MNSQLATITVTFQTRTGWIRFVLAVANLLTRLRLRLVSGVWLWLLQPTFIMGIHIKGQRRFHIWRFRFWKRWTYRRLPIHVSMQLHRGQRRP